ncbi:MAG: aa3-type cytochrome c oxidase subunit IV [Rhizobiaceae bacterium]
MADQTYEVNHDDGAPMDYQEHENTYSMFLWLTKWGILFNVALMIAMAAGFFMGAGFVGGVLIFLILMIVAKIVA